jgi:hypothetical protein
MYGDIKLPLIWETPVFNRRKNSHILIFKNYFKDPRRHFASCYNTKKPEEVI